MLDFSHIPTFGNGDVQVFIGTRTSGTLPALSQVWTKPRGVSMIHILALGQGGDGQGSTMGSTSAGGQGGGSGAQSQLLISARYVPDVLYIGAGAGGNGTIAAPTIVAARPCGATYNANPDAQDTFLIAGGAIGNSNAAGAIGSIATAILSGKGTTQFLAGIAGATGGGVGGTPGSAVNGNTSGLMVSGGGGGGGMSASAAFAGGAAFTTALPTKYVGASTGGAAGTSGVKGGDGNHGISILQLDGLFFSGGGGGGTSYPLATISAPGNGGAGGYGCGGGGAGGAITGTVNGKGGKGGPGLVIITAW